MDVGEWFEKSFGRDYLLVYKHRDFAGALREVEAMAGWLALDKGARVLDLCCGVGRHSLALSQLGCRVTGVDLSPVLLGEARRSDTGGEVEWVQGDMRCIPLSEPFDAIVNLFTSFGYFEQLEDNGRVLGEMQRLLRPGGQWLIDFLNPVYVRANLVPHSMRADGGMRIDERRTIDGAFVRKRITITDEAGGRRAYDEQVRLLELSEFERMFRAAGLQLERVYGDYDGSAYDESASRRLIMLGVRGERV